MTYTESRKKAAIALLPPEIQTLLGKRDAFNKDILELKHQLKTISNDYRIMKSYGQLARWRANEDNYNTYENYEDMMKAISDEIEKKKSESATVKELLERAKEKNPKIQELLKIAMDEKKYKELNWPLTVVGTWKAGSGAVSKPKAPSSSVSIQAGTPLTLPKSPSQAIQPKAPTKEEIRHKEIIAEFDRREADIRNRLEANKKNLEFHRANMDKFAWASTKDKNSFAYLQWDWSKSQVDFFTNEVMLDEAALSRLQTEKLAALRNDVPMTSLPTTSLSGLSEVNGKHLNLVFWLGVAAAIAYFLDEDVRNIFKR